MATCYPTFYIGESTLQREEQKLTPLYRHEPPIVAGKIKILYDGRLPGNDGETLVVVKPGSMPVRSLLLHRIQA